MCVFSQSISVLGMDSNITIHPHVKEGHPWDTLRFSKCVNGAHYGVRKWWEHVTQVCVITEW